MASAELIATGEWQAGLCRDLGAPTWAAVIETLLGCIDGEAAAARLLRDDDSDPRVSNVWLRFLGAVHRLVLDDPAVSLAALLPTTGGAIDPPRAAPAFLEFVEERARRVGGEMQQRVQTNEVARAGALSAAMNWLGGDLYLYEIGASAGLNLWMDRYRVVAVGRAWGPAGASVALEGLFRGGELPDTSFVVRGRRGCDLNPLNPADHSDVRVLRSFVWPDHADRLRRLDAAIATASPVRIDAEGAVDWCGRQLQRLGPGRTVVYHSIVLPYLSADERDALANAIADAGRDADMDHALAWVALEMTECCTAELTVRRWPERDAVRLATLKPHGADIRWHPTRLD